MTKHCECQADGVRRGEEKREDGRHSSSAASVESGRVKERLAVPAIFISLSLNRMLGCQVGRRSLPSGPWALQVKVLVGRNLRPRWLTGVLRWAACLLGL